MHATYNSQLPHLNRIEGQVKGIKKMIENRRYCVDILIQLKAVKAALHKVEQEILRTHILSCLKSAVGAGDEDKLQGKLEELMVLLDKRI